MLQNVKQQLDTDFAVLSKRSVDCDDAKAKAEHEIYIVLSKAYLFYRQVMSQAPEYLEERYREEDIRGNDRRDNRVNFH